MLELSSLKSTANSLGGRWSTHLDVLLSALSVQAGVIEIVKPDRVKDHISVLPGIAAFGSNESKIAAHCLSTSLARTLGISPASIDHLYEKIGRGETTKFTVPAMNMRAIAYQSARGVLRAMGEQKVGAAIFELSRGEVGFTGQRPHEYATAILCAAIAEGFQGPLFLQGDHFQISASRYAEDPEQD